MENPISYSDLFSPDIQQGIEGLVSDIMRVEKQLKGMLEGVKSEAQSLGEALAGVSSATKGGRDTTKADSAQVDKLYEAYTQLSKMYEENQKTLKALLDTEKTQNERLAKAKTATDEYASALDRLKAQAALANEALAKVGTSGNSAEIKQLQAVVNGLEAQVKNLTKAQNANAASAKSMGGANSSQKGELLSLADAYKTLSPLIKQTGVDLSSLITTEKQHQQVSKNGQIANTALAGSYNQLYAQYNLLKTALNAMSTEMRNNTAVGREWEAEALRIMNEMKAMQEATGKYTLDVGNYSEGVTKALNGLNISTMQVLREMPTLANSLQQFFIAISNNVPIFVDNFKRAQDELGGFTKAIGATLKAVFSWQTALLVILTILPKIAKAISDKRKAQQEDNKETQKQVNLMNLLREALVAVAKAEVSEVAKLRTLVSITNDHNRSMEERITAATELKNLHEDELKNYSAEEIALGKAKTATDAITKALMEQAKARALLNKMTEAYTKQIDAEDERNQLGASRVYEYGFDNGGNIAGFYKYVQNKIKQGFSEEYLKKNIAFVAKGDQDVWERYDKYKQALKDIQTFGATIEALTKRIPIGGLLSEVSDKTTKEKDRIFKELDEIPDFYFDLMQSIVNLTKDELDKELAQFDLNNEILKAKREEQMDELVDLEEELQKRIGETKDKNEKKEYEAELAFVQGEIKNLHQIQLNEELAFETARTKLVQEHAEKRLEIKRKNVQTEQQIAKANRDKLAYEEYEAGMNALDKTKDNTAKEIELKNALNKALLDSEKQYWEDYLKQLRDKGLLTVEAYNNIRDKIAGFNNAKPTSQATPNRKKRGSKQFRNVTELGFAMSNTFGEDILDENGKKIGRKIKDDYMDFANAVNEALQTSMDYMDEWMDKRIEMAEVAVEAAQKETESAKTALDYEMQARANGYANNVELARKEYEQKLQMEREAIAERKRLEKIQESINTAQQIGALVTATANLWMGYTKIPIVGPALAIAATALMWGSFFAAKIQAAQLARAETHGQGMAEYIDYGGSHASHNDVDFGHTKDGRRRRVERGEVVGVVRKDKVQKYGIERVMNIINNLNNGTFEKNYVSSTELVNSVMGESPESRANSAFLSAKVEDMLRSAESRSMGLKTGNTGIFDAGQLEANYEMAFNGASTDLSGVEQGIETLIEQNKIRVVSTPWGRIEYKGNNKRIIRNG
jgi:hypothetical protein